MTEVIPFVFRLFLIESALNELANLNKRNNAEAKTHCNKVFLPTDSDHTEYARNGRDENDHACEDEREKSRAPEPLVLTLDGEDRAVERSHIEGVEYLAHSKCEECHSRSVDAVRDLEVTGFKPVSDKI